MLLKLENNYWNNQLKKSMALGKDSFINHDNKTCIVKHEINFYVGTLMIKIKPEF